MQSALEVYLGVHDEGTKLVEEFTLQRLGKKIANHFTCRAVLNREFLAVDAVGDEVVSAVEMLSEFAAGLAAILFKENSTLIVLLEYSIFGAVSLGVEKIIGQEDYWHKVVSSNQLSLG